MVTDNLKLKVIVEGAEESERKISNVSKATGQDKNTGLTGSFFKAGLALEIFNKGVQVINTLVDKSINIFSDASKEAIAFEKSMTTLSIVSGKFGVSEKQAQELAKSLGRELRIGVGPAAEGLQNLLKTGLNLDQASDLMKRFTNEAITGKSANIDLSTAVQNLSFAFMTENSTLGNMSGISENYNDIIERGAKLMGKKTAELTEAERIEAKYRGMIELTNLTLGSSERFTGTLIDTQARLDTQWQEMQVTLGQKLNPIINEFLGFISNTGVIDTFGNVLGRIVEFFKSLRPFMDEVKQKFQEIYTTLEQEGVIQSLRELGATLKDAVSEYVRQSIRNAVELWKQFSEWLKTPEGRQALKEVKEAIRQVGEQVKAALPTIMSFGRFFLEVAKQGLQLYNTLIKIKNAIGSIVSHKGILADPNSSLSRLIMYGPRGGMDGGYIKGFATGGPVAGPKIPGLTRDNILVRAEEGEVILNRGQQAGIMAQLDRPNNNVTINVTNNGGMAMDQNGLKNLFNQLLLSM